MDSISIEYFPFGKRFAVTLIDDTDCATLEEIKPVYECLDAYGIRTTKTVWPFNATSKSGNYHELRTDGDTLENNSSYRDYCLDLQSRGFEIAMHTASAGNSKREETIRAYRFFEEIFGYPPVMNVMHARNIENIYWGKYSVPNPLLSKLIGLMEPLEFSGHKLSSEYYWGDICKEKTKYVRNFETIQTNTLLFDPATPYHDPHKPDVNWWFSSSFGSGIRLFTLLSEQNLERLARQRGASLIHLYCRFYGFSPKTQKYEVNPKFEKCIENLARHTDGWYVTGSEILDRLRAIQNLQITVNNGKITICNNSDVNVKDLALNISPDMILRLPGGQNLEFARNAFGQINLGMLKSQDSVCFATNTLVKKIFCPTKSSPNYSKLVAGYVWRICWQIAHGRRKSFSKKELPWVTAVWDD